MLSAVELLNYLNQTDETVWIEAKKGSSIGKSIMETVCAFSNEPNAGGGYILLGVEKSNKSLKYNVIGVDEPDKVQQDLVNQCYDTFNQIIRPKVKVEQVEGKNLIIVKIEEVANARKPVYFRKTGIPRGAFRRFGSADNRCSEDDITELYANHSLENYDSSALNDSQISDIDNQAVDLYRSLRLKINPSAEEVNWTDEEILYSIGCLNKKGNVYTPTVAGILLFGTQKALRRYFPIMRIDYIRISGNKWIADADKRFETVEIRKPLIEAVHKIQTAIIEDLPKTFSLPEGSIQNSQIPLLPQRVIREAIVNAVMHRSYRINSAIQVLKYSNRLEIRNPGHSLKSQDKLGEPGSKTRNPKIAAVFHDLGIAETKGSGIRVMRELMKENNLFEPAFESTREPDEFAVTFLFHHFLEQEDINWLNSFNLNFTEDQMKALFFVRETGSITNSIYREINSLGTLDASLGLRKLRDAGLLVQNGGGSKTYYTPTQRFKAPLNAEDKDYSEHLSNNCEHLNSEHLQISSEHFQKIQSIAFSISKRKKAPKLIVQKAITDMCGICELSIRQIAYILERKEDTIRNHYINKLCEKGVLEPKFPKIKHHPKQKYRLKR